MKGVGSFLARSANYRNNFEKYEMRPDRVASSGDVIYPVILLRKIK